MMTPVVRRWVAAALAVAVVATLAVFLVVRARDDGPTATDHGSRGATTIEVRPLSQSWMVLVTALDQVPADAEYLTLTDLDEIRARLGVPGLTSEDTMTDRQAFWDRAEDDAVLLTDGLLRADNSELSLDYGFTEDDVSWELRFAGPDGGGYVLQFRDDQDMSVVRAAVDAGVGPLRGADVVPQAKQVTLGVAEPGEPAWRDDPDLVGLVGEPAESTYVRRGCIPFADALGTDVTVEDQDVVLADHDIAGLDDLPAVAVSFGDDVATAWFTPGRSDLFDRADLVDDWPTTGSIGFGDGFSDDAAVDPSTGRIGLHVTNPVAAAHLTLTEILPFGVCNDATPLDEPTGL